MSKSNKNKNKMKRQNRGKKQKANKLSGDTSAWTTFESQYLLLLFFKEKKCFFWFCKTQKKWLPWCSTLLVGVLPHHDTITGTEHGDFKIIQLRGTNMKCVIWWRKENIFTNRCVWFSLSWTSKYIRKQQLHLRANLHRLKVMLHGMIRNDDL